MSYPPCLSRLPGLVPAWKQKNIFSDGWFPVNDKHSNGAGLYFQICSAADQILVCSEMFHCTGHCMISFILIWMQPVGVIHFLAFDINHSLWYPPSSYKWNDFHFFLVIFGYTSRPEAAAVHKMIQIHLHLIRSCPYSFHSLHSSAFLKYLYLSF